MKASIITIGDELLNGDKIDTNSVWISQQLNNIGISIINRISVGDIYNDIWQALDYVKQNSKFIFITGGLGPTKDDITKSLLCKYFNGNLALNTESLEIIKKIFAKNNKQLLDINIKQAYIPDTCKVILNEWGTAPCMWFEKEEKIFVSMPGVPFEMKEIMINKILPKLNNNYSNNEILNKYILTYNIGESFLAEKIKDIENKLPEYIKLAYLPSYGFVKLRLTALFDKKVKLKVEKEISDFHTEISILLKENLIGNTYTELIDYIIELCEKNNLTLATAESCTAGFISHLLTQKDGSSNYYLGSINTYNNTIKNSLLNVSLNDLENYSAVSEQVVKQMLNELLIKIPAKYGIAISGYLSSKDNNTQYKVGKIFIAVGSLKHNKVYELNLKYNLRLFNRETASIQAINYLKIFIENDLK